MIVNACPGSCLQGDNGSQIKAQNVEHGFIPFHFMLFCCCFFFPHIHLPLMLFVPLCVCMSRTLDHMRDLAMAGLKLKERDREWKECIDEVEKRLALHSSPFLSETGKYSSCLCAATGSRHLFTVNSKSCGRGKCGLTTPSELVLSISQTSFIHESWLP